MKQVIRTKLAPQAIGTYSQAIKVANTVYLSGQIGLDPSTMQLISPEFSPQLQQIFKNIQAVVEAAGGNLSGIVKMTIYLTDLAHFDTLNQIMATLFEAPYPARTVIAVSALPKNALVEIDTVLMT